jgi:hypothetical protein
MEILAQGIGKPVEEIEKDINRPKYFNPWEAVDYGLIDQVQDCKFRVIAWLCVNQNKSRTLQVLDNSVQKS